MKSFREALSAHPLAKVTPPAPRFIKEHRPRKHRQTFVALGEHGSKNPQAIAVVTGIDQDLMEIETIPDGAVLHLERHTRKVKPINGRGNFDAVRALWIGVIPDACQSVLQKLGYARNQMR